MLPDLEHRAVAGAPRRRLDRIVGHAMVFDVRWRDLGGFVEVVKPQPWIGARPGDVVAFYNHDAGAVLGRTPKTLQLREGCSRPGVHARPGADAGRPGCPRARAPRRCHRRQLRIHDEEGRLAQDGGLMVRELLDIEIAEISLTAFPAYRETDVDARAAVAAGGDAFRIHGYKVDSLAATAGAGAMTDDELRALQETVVTELAPLRDVTNRC